MSGSSAGASAAPSCPLEADGALHLEGRIGSTRVRVWVTYERTLGWAAGAAEETDPSRQIYGLFYEIEDWEAGRAVSPGVLWGRLSAGCRLALTESEDDDPGRDGAWALTFDRPGRAVGVRTTPGGAKASIDLRVAPPRDCTGTGPWKRFRDPAWPVTFEYPSGWRIDAQRHAVHLECPSLEAMARGGYTIELSWGTGDGVRDTGEEGREGLVLEPFVTFGDGLWHLPADDCLDNLDSVFCNRAGTFTLNGMAVVYGSAGDSRLHGPGRGYLGQGGGQDFLFRLTGRWGHLRTSRGALPDPVDGAPAPALDGADVDSRLLRSVRPTGR